MWLYISNDVNQVAWEMENTARVNQHIKIDFYYPPSQTIRKTFEKALAFIQCIIVMQKENNIICVKTQMPFPYLNKTET